MKFLFMILSAVMWMTISFVLTDTLYTEEGRIIKDGDYYVVKYTDKPTSIVMNNKWDSPSRIVY